MAQLTKYLSHHLNPYAYCRKQAWGKVQGAMKVFQGRRKNNNHKELGVAVHKYGGINESDIDNASDKDESCDIGLSG